MAVDHESEAATTLVASLIRQLYVKRLFNEDDIAAIFGHADEAISGKPTPRVDAIWLRAQEIIAG